MATITTPSPNVASQTTRKVSSDVAVTIPSPRRWVVGSWFDLLFLMNAFWPLAFLPGFVSPEGTPYANYWMAYFLATPHRWMTLFLAVTDSDRRAGRTWLFTLLGIGATALVVGVYFLTHDFRTLALPYALVVGWHFAAQHAGILRIYGRRSGGKRRWMDTWPPRIFVLYGALRMLPGIDQVVDFTGLELGTLDWTIFALPAMMITAELIDWSWNRLQRFLYMVSFMGLYGSLILAVHYQNIALCFALLAATTIFHSVEYLAIVTYYAGRRRTVGSENRFRRFAKNWTVFLAWYVLLIGSFYCFADNASMSVVTVWFGMNLIASILHCVYDGMMWKLRRPATAEVLEVSL